MSRKGHIQKKVLLLLLAGVTLGMTRSVTRQLKVIKDLGKEWDKIDRIALERSINLLYKSHLVSQKSNRDGTTTFILTKEGKTVALKFNIDEMEVTKHPWDKTWRIVIFDIPERLKKVRDALRYHLKKLGFIELQRSVFVIPYQCRGEIEYIIEFYNARRFIRFIEARYIDNELDLKRKFNLK